MRLTGVILGIISCKKKACDQLFILTKVSLQSRSRICSTVKAIIEERKRNAGNSRNSDFLEILLTVNTLYEEEQVSFVLDSLLGGYETTSLLMAMVVHFLCQSPLALQQLKVTIPICNISEILYLLAFVIMF